MGRTNSAKGVSVSPLCVRMLKSSDLHQVEISNIITIYVHKQSARDEMAGLSRCPDL